MKKSLIALAVAATAAAPMIASAASHGPSGATVYGSFRTQLVSNGGDLDIGDGGSRYGVKGTHDLGNDMSAFYRIELKAATDTANFPEGGRLGYVGVSGGFGSVALGQQWNPYYNSVASSSDPFASAGLPFSPTPFRTGNALSYTLASGGAVSGGIMLSVDGDSAAEDEVDAVSLGVSFAAGPMTVGLGVHDVKTADDALVGLSLGGNVGGANVILLMEDAGDTTPWALTAKVGAFLVQYSDDDADDDALTLGYTHKLGGKAKVQFSVQDVDSASDTKVVARLRVDI